jgi:hypothetical protein
MNEFVLTIVVLQSMSSSVYMLVVGGGVGVLGTKAPCLMGNGDENGLLWKCDCNFNVGLSPIVFRLFPMRALTLRWRHLHL